MGNSTMTGIWQRKMLRFHLRQKQYNWTVWNFLLGEFHMMAQTRTGIATAILRSNLAVGPTAPVEMT